MIMSCVFHKSHKQEPRTLIAPFNIEHADSDDNHTTLHELYTRCRLFFFGFPLCMMLFSFFFLVLAFGF